MTQFVSGLFESTNDLPTFKNHIRDFLVQSKEFSSQVSVTSRPFVSELYWYVFCGEGVLSGGLLFLYPVPYIRAPEDPNRLSCFNFGIMLPSFLEKKTHKM